ncbi:MAG: glycosyltransferase family 2 protein [Chloroflexota bacterium]|nr:glycosyltransferase family 2 protein [Chloroflexota bacterium]
MMDSGPTLPIVSLIVPVRNEERHIGRCLASVQAQEYPEGRLEVIVVDGESADGTRAVAAKLAEGRVGWQVFDNPRRALIPGMNLGIQRAAGDYIGYVNGHSELPPDYVRRMVELAKLHQAWSVGGRINRVSESPTQAAFAVVMAHPLGVGDSRHNYATVAGPAETVFPGFWPRWVFERVGLFDERMAANEDNELSHRISMAGGLVWYDPSVVVRYHPRATFGESFRQLHGYGSGKVQVWRTHPSALRPRQLVPAAWVAFLGIGLVATVMRPALLSLYAAGIGTYAAITGVASARLSGGRLIAAVRTWGAFATVHAGYGIGIWRGLLEWAVASLRRSAR